MSITTEEKAKVISEFATKKGDTGSPEVQIAILTSRIKQNPDSSGYAATFTASYSDASSGILKLELTAEQTKALKSGRYFYDVVVINEDKPSADFAGDLHTERLVQGQIIVE